jgi:hypothetical protein
MGSMRRVGCVCFANSATASSKGTPSRFSGPHGATSPVAQRDQPVIAYPLVLQQIGQLIDYDSFLY